MEAVLARVVGQRAEVQVNGQMLRVAHSDTAGRDCPSPSEMIVVALTA